MLHRHAVEEVDGVASTEDDPHLVKEHVFVISDDPDYGKIHQTAKKKSLGCVCRFQRWPLSSLVSY